MLRDGKDTFEFAFWLEQRGLLLLSLMTLERLRTAFSFRRHDASTKQQSRRAGTALPATRLSARDPDSWSSTHEDFTCLRFFVWTGGDPGFTLTTNNDDRKHALACDEDAELKVDRVTAQKVWEAGFDLGMFWRPSRASASIRWTRRRRSCWFRCPRAPRSSASARRRQVNACALTFYSANGSWGCFHTRWR